MLVSHTFEYLASIEIQGYEFTACCQGPKRGHCLFGTSNGRLFYIKHVKAFANLEVVYKREVPLYGPDSRPLVVPVTQIVPLGPEEGVYALATLQGISMLKID